MLSIKVSSDSTQLIPVNLVVSVLMPVPGSDIVSLTPVMPGHSALVYPALTASPQSR
jgi:hypothetical protein